MSAPKQLWLMGLVIVVIASISIGKAVELVHEGTGWAFGLAAFFTFIAIFLGIASIASAIEENSP